MDSLCFRCTIAQWFCLMTSKPKAQLAPLPWTEILAYWVLSFGSHLYSFYQLHRFSKGKEDRQMSVRWFSELRRKGKEKWSCCFLFCTSEHEAGLQREFQLETGLLRGFKRVRSMLKLLKSIVYVNVSYFVSQKLKKACFNYRFFKTLYIWLTHKK